MGELIEMVSFTIPNNEDKNKISYPYLSKENEKLANIVFINVFKPAGNSEML